MKDYTLGNKLRAIANFGKLLLTPSPDLDRYEKNQSHVLLRDPKFCLEYAPFCQSTVISEQLSV